MAEKQCRFCMSRKSWLVDIFEEGRAGMPYHAIKACVPCFQENEASKAFPRFVCYKCLAFIQHMKTFQDMAEKSSETFTIRAAQQHSQKQLTIGSETQDFRAHYAREVESRQRASQQGARAEPVAAPQNQEFVYKDKSHATFLEISRAFQETASKALAPSSASQNYYRSQVAAPTTKSHEDKPSKRLSKPQPQPRIVSATRVVGEIPSQRSSFQMRPSTQVTFSSKKEIIGEEPPKKSSSRHRANYISATQVERSDRSPGKSRVSRRVRSQPALQSCFKKKFAAAASQKQSLFEVTLVTPSPSLKEGSEKRSAAPSQNPDVFRDFKIPEEEEGDARRERTTKATPLKRAAAAVHLKSRSPKLRIPGTPSVPKTTRLSSPALKTRTPPAQVAPTPKPDYEKTPRSEASSEDIFSMAFCYYCEKRFPPKTNMFRHFMLFHEDIMYPYQDDDPLAMFREALKN